MRNSAGHVEYEEKGVHAVVCSPADVAPSCVRGSTSDSGESSATRP